MTLANNFRFTTLLMTSQPAAAKNSNTNLSFDFPSAHKKILFMMMMIIKPQIPIYVFFFALQQRPLSGPHELFRTSPVTGQLVRFFLDLFISSFCVPCVCAIRPKSAKRSFDLNFASNSILLRRTGRQQSSKFVRMSDFVSQRTVVTKANYFRRQNVFRLKFLFVRLRPNGIDFLLNEI